MKVITKDRRPKQDADMLNSGFSWYQCDGCTEVHGAMLRWHKDICPGRHPASCDVCGQTTTMFYLDQVTPFTEEPFYADVCLKCSKQISGGPIRKSLLSYICVWHILLVFSGIGADVAVHWLGH